MNQVIVESAVVIALWSLLSGTASSSAQELTLEGTDTRTAAVGAGRWESAQATGDKRDWQIQIERFTDDSIAGSIIVISSPYLHKARIEGRVDGKEVYGVLARARSQDVTVRLIELSESSVLERLPHFCGRRVSNDASSN